MSISIGFPRRGPWYLRARWLALVIAGLFSLVMIAEFARLKEQRECKSSTPFLMLNGHVMLAPNGGLALGQQRQCRVTVGNTEMTLTMLRPGGEMTLRLKLPVVGDTTVALPELLRGAVEWSWPDGTS